MARDYLDYKCGDCLITVHVESLGYHVPKLYCPECGSRMKA